MDTETGGYRDRLIQKQAYTGTGRYRDRQEKRCISGRRRGVSVVVGECISGRRRVYQW